MSELLMTSERDILQRPLLRWVGGKTWLINTIKRIAPADFNRYHEPFLGGAAIFFSMTPSKAFLSDLNNDLINFYRQLKKQPDELIHHLQGFKVSEDEFYKVRSIRPQTSLERAARFLYLNKTCFNGIYRVNTQGKFNVPYGAKKNTTIVNKQTLLSASEILSTAKIRCCDFMDTLAEIKKGDFVFIDPPYTVTHNLNGFLEYNQKIFSWEDQKRLRTYIEKIISFKAFFVLTNADHSSIKNLYEGLAKTLTVERHSTISAKISKRQIITELIITNCI